MLRLQLKGKSFVFRAGSAARVGMWIYCDHFCIRQLLLLNKHTTPELSSVIQRPSIQLMILWVVSAVRLVQAGWLISDWLVHAFVVSWQVSWGLDDLRWLYSHVWHLTGCRLELGCLSSLPHNSHYSAGQARLIHVLAVQGSQGEQESKPQNASPFQFFSVAQNTSYGQARLRRQGNRLHFLVEGSKTLHRKNMDTGKGRIRGHFYNLPHLPGEDVNLSGVISLNQKVH